MKSIDQNVFSIGFPVNAFDTAPKKVKEEWERVVIRDKIIELGADIETFEDEIVVKNISCDNNILYNKWCLQQKELNLLREQQYLYKK